MKLEGIVKSYLPSPLGGEGQGEGYKCFLSSSCYAPQSLHPHPFPSPLKGEGFLSSLVFSGAGFYKFFFDIILLPYLLRGSGPNCEGR